MFNRKEYLRKYQLDWYHKHKETKGLSTVAMQRKHKRKLKAIALLGGKCQECGYNKCVAALDFHHVGMKTEMMSNIWSYKWETILLELKECKLLCANCHREEHYAVEDA